MITPKSLLKAAPELLEACQMALKELRTLRDTKPAQWDALVTPGLCEVWDNLKSAIAKAEVK